MADTYTPAAKANSRRDFLRFLALAPATAAVAPALKAARSDAEASRQLDAEGWSEPYISTTPPLPDGEARRQLAEMKWGEPYISTTPPMTREEVQAVWDSREQDGVPWNEVLRRRGEVAA